MANNDKDSKAVSKGMIARIFILLLTAFIGIGFIYTMIYKGKVYEALFGNQGYFSDFKDASTPSDKKPDPTIKVSVTPKNSPTPTATEDAEKSAEPTPSLTPEATPTPAPSASFEPLAKGMNSTRVRELQTLLTKKGYFESDNITDYFGSITENAVMNFQNKNGLPVTGIVDQATFEKLKAAKDVM